MAAQASLVSALASLVLLAHLLWIVLVIFGALWTRGRPIWSAVHIAALAWAIAVEAGPWSCPLTLAEQYFEARTGITPYQGSFSSTGSTPSSTPTCPAGQSPSPESPSAPSTWPSTSAAGSHGVSGIETPIYGCALSVARVAVN